jgi:S1-C subfamily serine protease
MEMKKTNVRNHLVGILLAALVVVSAWTAILVSADQGAPTANLGRIQVADAATLVPTAYTRTQAAATVAGDLQTSLIALYQETNPSVVQIVLPNVGSGSGFVYDSDGHIVTNNHVAEGGRSYEIIFASGERRSATLVGTDADADLAVLKVSDLPAGVEPLRLAQVDDLAVGQFVIAIGNPFGEQNSMTLGIVSGLGRSLPSQRSSMSGSGYSLPQVIQTDAAINPGNSGGPLLNLNGEIVGVNAAIASSNGTNSGVGFSIPVSAVRKIVPAIIEDGSYEYPYLGASFDDEINLTEQRARGLPQTTGAYVMSVTAGGPADRAGLVAASPSTGLGGDLIVALDGQPIADFQELNSYLVFHTSVGQTIKMTVLRDGKQNSLSLTLGSRP